MRWMLTLVALVAGAWLLSTRQRRAQVQETLRGLRARQGMPWRGTTSGDETTGMPDGITARARAGITQVQAAWPQMASRVADVTKSASSTVVQKAQELSKRVIRSDTDQRGDAAARGAGAGTAGIAGTGEAPAFGTSDAGEIAPAEGRPAAYIGNRHTRVFHSATADNLPAEENRVYFATAAEALAAGFRPAEGEGLDADAEL